MKNTIVGLLYLLLICFILNSEEIIRIKFSEENYIDTKLHQNIEENNNKIFLNAMNIYPAEQIIHVLNNQNNDIFTMNEYGNCLCTVFTDDKITVNDMILNKALVYKYENKKVYSGLCVFINLNNDFRQTHTYINNCYITTVFDEKGNSYLLSDFLNQISLYPLEDKMMQNGGIGKDYFNPIINYLDCDTKQIKCYDIQTGNSYIMKGLPPFTKPVLYYGYAINNKKDISELNLMPLQEGNLVADKKSVFRRVLDGRDYDGNKYYLDTIYLLDYDFDGTRKKGVYKIMGDKFEFYPDL